MSPDQFTEVTKTSYGSRIGNSFKGVIVGLILFVASFVLLFWNEGRAVRTAKTIEEGMSNVVVIDPAQVDQSKQGKLVYLSGQATTGETLTDPELAVGAKAIKLVRHVEMYQWQEKKETKTEKKVGGSEETKTTYTYSKDWSEDPIDSGKFAHGEGHGNPSQMPMSRRVLTAEKVTLGAFTLPKSVKDKIEANQPRDLTAEDWKNFPDSLKSRARLSDGWLYVLANPPAQTSTATSNPASGPAFGPVVPQIGDVRVKLSMAAPGDYSVIARQISSTLEPYTAATGNTIELVSPGIVSAQQMFAREASSNKMITWLLRLAGFLAMFIGLIMMVGPIAVVADVLPFLGDLMRMGAGLVAFPIALVLSLTTIAIAWIFYRPLIGISLLVLAALAIAGFVTMARKKRAKAAVEKA